MSPSVASKPLDWHLSRVHELTYYDKVQDITASTGGRTWYVKYNHHPSLKEIPLFHCKIQLINISTLHQILLNFVTSRFQPHLLLDFGHLTPPITYILTGHAAMWASAHWLAPQTRIHLSYLQGEGKHLHTSGYVVSIYLSSLFLTGNNCVNLVLMH